MDDYPIAREYEELERWGSELQEGDMSEWLSIASATDQGVAPWDGKPVLICTNHNWTSRVHRAIWTDSVHGNGIFGWAVEDCKFGPYPLRGYTLVTHWMPLPEPAQTEG